MSRDLAALSHHFFSIIQSCFFPPFSTNAQTSLPLFTSASLSKTFIPPRIFQYDNPVAFFPLLYRHYGKIPYPIPLLTFRPWCSFAYENPLFYVLCCMPPAFALVTPHAFDARAFHEEVRFFTVFPFFFFPHQLE